jgi:AcrR family transcriptional regulator
MDSVPQQGVVGRRTQEERRASTRKRLMAATIESLIECGYNGATTLEIERCAGVSRGARIHHFPTKASLLAAAVDHLYDRISGSYAEAFGTPLPGISDAQRVRTGLRAMWNLFRERDHAAVIELNVAARTDDELRQCLQEVGDRHRTLAIEAAAQLFGVSADVACPLIETIHAALMGLVLRRNVRANDQDDDASIALLEDLLITNLKSRV